MRPDRIVIVYESFVTHGLTDGPLGHIDLDGHNVAVTVGQDRFFISPVDQGFYVGRSPDAEQYFGRTLIEALNRLLSRGDVVSLAAYRSRHNV